jgi:hypothetical protein
LNKVNKGEKGKMVCSKRIKVFSVVVLTGLFMIGCKSHEPDDDLAQREFEQRLQEAQELAMQIREGSLFDDEAQRKERIMNPENVCMFSTHFWAVDFSADPDFRGDGAAAIYNDSHGIVYYYDLNGKQRYNIYQFAKHPSFGMFQPEGEQAYVFQKFDRVMTEKGREVIVHGIKMNIERDWMSPPKTLYEGNASHPYLVNNDRNVIFIQDDKYFLLDENLQKTQITQQEYSRLRDSRFEMNHQWQIRGRYRGIPGLWITDMNEKNWVMIRPISELETVKIIPGHYSIYYWGNELVGVFELVPGDLQQFSVKLDDNHEASVGELFDIYEKRVSPISQEVIGYDKEKYKGTLRIVDVIEGYYICEYQTRIYLQGIYKDDIAVMQKDNNIHGHIL